jgi:hypothetical protein
MRGNTNICIVIFEAAWTAVVPKKAHSNLVSGRHDTIVAAVNSRLSFPHAKRGKGDEFGANQPQDKSSGDCVRRENLF